MNSKSKTELIKNFVSDEQGQDVVEYSLLLVLIGMAAIFILTAMGRSIGDIFSRINEKLSTANSSLGSAE